MNIVLPKEIAYNQQLPALPECTTQDIVIAPANNQVFPAGELIQFDLNSRGYLDPSSLYLRFQVVITKSGTSAGSPAVFTPKECTIKGTPAYSFFNKLQTHFSSTVVENITNYGQVCNMMTNCQMDTAMKYGLQTAYGWGGGGDQSKMDSFITVGAGPNVGAVDTLSFAVPLPCILSMAEHLIPLGLMPGVRIELTVDSIANIFLAADAPTNIQLKNVELCYTMIDFNGSVNDIVKGMGEQFYIKSTSFNNIGASVSTIASGSSVEIVYNQRLASIKSLFALFCSQDGTKSINGNYDSVDITSENGDLAFNIAGTSYPARPVRTSNRGAVLMELKKAFGALHSESYNFSINRIEFGYNHGSPTTADEPGKYFFGVNTEKLSSSGVLLSGVSTQNSPITLRISTGTAVNNTYTIYCIAMYDALIQIDPHNRQAVVKQ